MKAKLLGIDYGDSKIGLAVSFGKLADPLTVIRNNESENALGQIARLVEKHNIDEIVVGVSEKDSAKKAQKFGGYLKQKLGLPVHFQDETLSTRDAQMLSIEAGIKRNKRKGMEDAYAATLILQRYLDR